MKTIKNLLSIGLLAVITSCSGPAGNYTNYDTVCVEGVLYYTSGVRWSNNYAFAPAFDTNSKIIKCEE